MNILETLKKIPKSDNFLTSREMHHRYKYSKEIWFQIVIDFLSQSEFV